MRGSTLIVEPSPPALSLYIFLLRKVVSHSASECLPYSLGQTLCKIQKRRYLSLRVLLYSFTPLLSTVLR